MQGTILKLGPRGGLQGGPQDMELNGVTRIVKVVVGHEEIVVNSVSFSFLRYGREERTSNWGGEGGVRTDINLHPNEYLTSVKGHYGKHKRMTLVKSLTFVTNLQTYGPFGKEEGDPFHFPTHGGKIIGFHGRSGDHIDALGTYVKFDVKEN